MATSEGKICLIETGRSSPACDTGGKVNDHFTNYREMMHESDEGVVLQTDDLGFL